MHYTVCDYLLDIFQNALEAGSMHTVVEVRETSAWLAVRVEDRGKGMTPSELARSRDPFYTEAGKHPGRQVGLGLPFLAALAEAVGGSFSVDSAPGRGTMVEFGVPVEHIDTPPVGDIPGTFMQMLCFAGDYEVEIHRIREFPGSETRQYVVRRSEVSEALEDLETAASLSLLRDFLRSQEEELTEGEV